MSAFGGKADIKTWRAVGGHSARSLRRAGADGDARRGRRGLL